MISQPHFLPSWLYWRYITLTRMQPTTSIFEGNKKIYDTITLR